MKIGRTKCEDSNMVMIDRGENVTVKGRVVSVKTFFRCKRINANSIEKDVAVSGV